MDVLPSRRIVGATRLRYVYQLFTWTQARLNNLKCDSKATYEADAVFYNNGSLAHYLRIPVSQASMSNLPDDYFDTSIGDRPAFPVWTIGTSDADKLVAGRGYFTIIQAWPGSATSERGEPMGQIGDIPGWCPGWAADICVFPNETVRLLEEDPSRQIEMLVPGRKTWVR